MSEQEYPVARGSQGTAAPPALTEASAAEENEAFEELAAPQQEQTEEAAEQEAGGETTQKRSLIGDFFRKGDALRRIIILAFLVLFLAGTIFGLIAFQGSSGNDAWRELGRYSPQEIGPVLDFLDLEGYDYRLSGSEGISVKAEQYQTIREAMLRRGIAIAQSSMDEGDNILMSDSGFGVSQRLEGERIKHGREMQLARAIERIDGIEHATVLLAIPRENVFARSERRPSAAVVVTLRNGVFLSPESVNSIRFMVAASVHNLLSKDVTVTDQTGRLLSSETSSSGTEDKLQKEFELRTLREAQYRDKLDSILGPMLGFGNYSAEVDVTLDTTVEEETRQIFNPDRQAVRSETLREERGSDEVTNPYGVPGSLSNQPPANAAIPQELRDGTAQGGIAENSGPNESREAVRNYEVDTTVRHTTRPTNTVSRLTVSVAVDYIRQVGENGVVSWVPRPQEDLNKIADLVSGGLGLDARRGDVVQVQTISFPHAEEPPMLPWWQQESFYRILRIAGAVLVVLILVVFVIRPMVNRLIKGKPEDDETVEGDLDDESALEGNDDLNLIAARSDMANRVYSINRDGGIELPNLRRNEDLLKAVRTLVSNEPQLSTEVVREWIASDLAEKKKA